MLSKERHQTATCPLDAYPAMKLHLEAFKALPQVIAYEQSKSLTLKEVRTLFLFEV
jgi:hypothetical protein